MQSIAVLLLEMSCEIKHVKSQEIDLVACIKKLMHWLHMLQVNDPVAARAYEVVWKILKTCTPPSESQENDLLTLEGMIPQQNGHLPDPNSSMEKPRSTQLPRTLSANLRGDQADIDPNLFESQTMGFFSGDQPGAYPSFTPDQIRWPVSFGTAFPTTLG